METKTKVMLGIGIGVLLIGGSVGAYFYFRKPKTKTIIMPNGTTTEVPIDDKTTRTTGTTPAPELVAGEASDIQYIVEGGSGGGAHAGMTLIKLVDGVVKTGDVVFLKHPNYNGQFTVSDNNDAYGGSIIYIDTPFKTTGTITEDANTVDRQKGTVAVMGVPTGSNFSGITGGIKKNVRFLSKAEATLRKQAAKEGKGKGLKAVALRDFIRTKAAASLARQLASERAARSAAQAEALKTPAALRTPAQNALIVVSGSGRGFDGSSSFSGEIDLANNNLLND